MTSPNKPPLELHPRQVDLINLIGKHKFTCAYGSSRGGKTFTYVYAMFLRALHYPGSNHAIIRETSASIESTAWKTAMDVIDALDPAYRGELQITKQPFRITLHNGSTIWFLGAKDEEQIFRLMGSEFATIFLNEVVNIDHKTYMRIITRLNANDVDAGGNRIKLKLFADCNPRAKSHWVYQQFVRKVVPGTEKPLVNPEAFGTIQFDRNANPGVDESYYLELENSSDEEKASFLDGEWYDEVEGALFSRADLNDNREPTPDKSEFDLIVVGVDPAVTNSPDSDETGIMVAGRIDVEVGPDKTESHFYPLADLSGRYHPHEWAAIVAKAYREWGAGAVVIETTQGGDQNAHTLRTADASLTILTVNPGRGQGKNMRAMPIAAEMRARHIHHPLGNEFQELEAQLLSMTGDYDRKRGKSPDRLDAYVYAISELLTGDGPTGPVVQSKIAGFFR